MKKVLLHYSMQFVRICICALLICMWTGSEAFSGSENSLTVRAYYYPPFYYQVDNKWVGIEIELVTKVLEKINKTPVFVVLPWARALEETKTGNLDIILSVSKTAERVRFIDYIGISRFEQAALLVHKADVDVSLADAKELCRFSKPVGIATSQYVKGLEERHYKDSPLSKCFEEVSDGSLNIKKLKAGRVSGVVEDVSYFVYQLHKDKDLRSRFALHPFRLSKAAPVYIGVSKKVSPKVRDAMQNAYNELVQDGELEQIYTKWGLHAPVSQEETRTR